MDRNRSRGWSRSGAGLAVVAVVAVLYVAGSGPLLGLALRHDPDPGGRLVSGLEFLYAPLLGQSNETAPRQWLDAYWAACFERIGVGGAFLPSPNPDDRVRQLIFVDEDLKHIPETWERVWELDMEPDRIEIEVHRDSETQPGDSDAPETTEGEPSDKSSRLATPYTTHGSVI